VVFDLGPDALNVRRAQVTLAAGQVSLDPTTIDLHAGSRFEGDLTVHGVDLGEVLAATSLSEQVKVQAVVDGRVPFTAGPSGVEIHEGTLSAVGGGRLSICRTALGAPASAAPVSGAPAPAAPASSACPVGASASSAAGAGQVAAADGGIAQDFAYQALENLAFDTLDARLNTLPKDRLGVIFHIKGRHDPPGRQKAIIRFADVVRGHALDRPVPLPSDTEIDLTLDTSLNFGEVIQALEAAWQDAIRPDGNHPESAAPGSEAPVKSAPAQTSAGSGEARHP
jgi:hypothetical protein